MANQLIGKDFTPPDVRGKVTGQAKAICRRLPRRRDALLSPAHESHASRARARHRCV